MTQDPHLVASLACRGVCIVVVFITIIVLSATIDGALYVQAMWPDCDEGQCRMIKIEQNEYSVDYSVGGGNIVDAGEVNGGVSANSGGISVDGGADIQAEGGSRLLQGEDECEGASLPSDPDANLVCDDCEGNSEYAWATSAKVSDLPVYCKSSEDRASQRQVFSTQEDAISGGLFLIPMLVWFMLRLLGVALEIQQMMNPKDNGGKTQKVLTWLGCSIVPGVCLKPLSGMGTAKSIPGVVFTMTDNTWFPLLFAYMFFFGIAMACYMGFEMRGKLSEKTEQYGAVGLLIAMLPILAVEAAFIKEFKTWSWGFSLQFSFSYPEIGFNRSLSVFNVVILGLFILDSLSLPLTIWKSLDKASPVLHMSVIPIPFFGRQSK